MKKLLLIFIIALFLSSCGPGQLFGPTTTSTPTATRTFTPTSTPTLTPSPTSTSTPTPTSTSTPTPTPTPFGASGGLIFNYYARGYSNQFNLRGNSNIFFSNPDGTGLRPLTTDGLMGYNQVIGISPDGRQALILSRDDQYQQQNRHIYTVNLDGSGTTWLDMNSMDTRDALWLPNGQIAYIANNYVYLVNPDGTNRVKIEFTNTRGFMTFSLFMVDYLKDRVFVGFSQYTNWFTKDSTFTRYLMLDGSGTIGEMTFENCTISPDGKYCAWEERVEDPSSVKGYKYLIFVAPSVISGDVQTINKTGKVEIPLPWLIDNLFNYPDQFWWSPSGSSLFITTKIYYDGNPNHQNYRFYIFNFADFTLDEIPYHEFDGLYRGWTPFNMVMSPDGKQLLITDNMAYIAILDLSTMVISREFGCTVSPTCPDHPSAEPSSFPYEFAKHLIIDSVFWLPATNP